MSKGIFIHSRNALSARLAIFEDDGQVAYVYLTKPGTQKPEKDVIAYSRVPPAPKVDWNIIGKAGNPPPLPQDVASASAVIPRPVAREFSLKWSTDGNIVALLRNGVPIAFVSASAKLGFSKAIARPSPIANPWDQSAYDAAFRDD
jgi:hypothetical protein